MRLDTRQGMSTITGAVYDGSALHCIQEIAGWSDARVNSDDHCFVVYVDMRDMVVDPG